MGYFSIVNFLSQVFEELIRSFDEKPDQNDKEEKELFQSMLSFVHSHYQDPLTVRQIAAYGIINKNRCTDLFRKYTRLSPIKYLNEYRLYMAKNLILNTKKPISEISADVGYNQISHFIEQFRGAYGLSPLKYRNQFAGQSSDRTSSLSSVRSIPAAPKGAVIRIAKTATDRTIWPQGNPIARGTDPIAACTVAFGR